MPLFDVRLTLTKEEILDGMNRAQLRRASRPRLIVQTIVLAAVGIWSMAAFFIDSMQNWGSLAIGLIALVLIPIMLFVPKWQMKSIAESIVENNEFVHMWVFEDGVDFDKKQPEAAYYAFGRFFCDQNEQSLVFRFTNDQVVVVPRRLLEEHDWRWLCEKTAQSADTRRRHL